MPRRTIAQRFVVELAYTPFQDDRNAIIDKYHEITVEYKHMSSLSIAYYADGSATFVGPLGSGIQVLPVDSPHAREIIHDA